MATNSHIKSLVVLSAILVILSSCGPKAIRGGPGTRNPELDEPAMSITLDRADLEYLVSENVKALSASALWNNTIEKALTPPTVAIWPIQNATSQHIDDQMAALLSSIETYLVNSGDVRMVSKENQQQLVQELRLREIDIYDPQTIGKLGRQLGAQYFATGKVTSVEERFQRTRRVQYSLILQILEVETGLIVFQNEATRSKALKG
ncbi:MAG: penicillin-binding protein activator LpoB [Phycisphaerae bacterium]|nr:penicillin-binding protein activator LpoB [Phycisphaerae bacterium]